MTRRPLNNKKMTISSFRLGAQAWLLLLLSVVLDTKGQTLIAHHPLDTEAFVGQSAVSLDCAIESTSGLTFDHWLHNGTPVDSGPDYDVSTTSRASVLEIRTFREELAGEYRCQMSSVEGTHTDILLSLSGVVRYFDQGGFSKNPVDFESYVLEKNDSLVDYTLGRKPREVIAFECTYAFNPLTTPPDISWQTCNGDSTFTDLPEANELPSPRERVRAYTFFQSNFTSYLQISNSTDPAYNGSSYRCKAASQISGDSAVVFSTCASVIHYDASVPVPDPAVLPVFRTVPERNIYVSESVDGVMACTVQNQPNLNNPRPILIQDSSNQSVITNYFSVVTGVENIGENNLRVDYFELFDDEIEEVTYTCRLDNTELAHQTTFHILREPLLDQLQQSIIVAVSEDSPVSLTLSLADSPVEYTFRAYKSGLPLATDGAQYTYAGQSTLHTLNIASAQESDRGVFQMEVANSMGTAVIYYRLRVSLKARPLTPNKTIEAKVSQTLLLNCRAAENGDGPYIDFEWKLGSTRRQSLGINPASNLAITSHRVSANLLLEDAGMYSCTPSNVIGSKGSTFYTVSVTKFDPPENVTVSTNETSLEVIVTWLPIEIDQTLYPGANVEEYIVELHTITPNGFVKVGELNVSGDSSEAVFNVNSVQNYQVRVKGRTGGRDVSDFTPLVLVPNSAPTPTSVTVATGVQLGLPGWAIFLILFFIFLAILLLLLIVAICCFCFTKRDPKGEYNAEKREEKYYQDMKTQA